MDGKLPPWLKFDIPLGSIGWRMGRGEDYWYEWCDWYATLQPQQVARYTALYPEPADWQGFYRRANAPAMLESRLPITPPRRRWFRLAFSLRSLFVLVTVLSCWLGWQINWIRQRHAYARAWEAELNSHGAYSGSCHSTTSPWPIHLLGAPAHTVLVLWSKADRPSNLTADDKNRMVLAGDLFPESFVCFRGDSPGSKDRWMATFLPDGRKIWDSESGDSDM